MGHNYRFCYLQIGPDDIFWCKKSIIDCHGVQGADAFSCRRADVEDHHHEDGEVKPRAHCVNLSSPFQGFIAKYAKGRQSAETFLQI